ncbi:MAG: hypothetical protein E6J24_14620 [Chloroflexi bacterium]|nr:MAG: hypothetical protein E6J24_14620 [Chloroflexota bacterium]
MAFVPFWAWQFVIGAVVVLLAITIASTLIGAAMRVPSAFLDDVGKAVSRVAPQPGADVETEDQLKKVIAAMPNGKLRVATVDAEHNRVVFTITAERRAPSVPRRQHGDRPDRRARPHGAARQGHGGPEKEVVRAIEPSHRGEREVGPRDERLRPAGPSSARSGTATRPA